MPTTANTAPCCKPSSPAPEGAKSREGRRHHYGPYHRPILAERFKTKMCANWTETGACPYFFRCMFAHGDQEMRTKQMNMADGLFTEEAIKAFKRAAYESSKAVEAASKSAAQAAVRAAVAVTDSTSAAVTPVSAMPPTTLALAGMPDLAPSNTALAMLCAHDSDTSSAVSHEDRATPTSAAAVTPAHVNTVGAVSPDGNVSPVCDAPARRLSVRGGRRHDPYAQRSLWQPIIAAWLPTMCMVDCHAPSGCPSPVPSAASSRTSPPPQPAQRTPALHPLLAAAPALLAA